MGRPSTKSSKSLSKTVDKRKRVNKGTLDQKHTEQLNKFKSSRESLPQKKKLLTLKRAELSKLSDKKSHKKVLLIEEIDNLTDEIRQIENSTDQLKYAINALDIVIDYYNTDNNVDETTISSLTRSDTNPEINSETSSNKKTGKKNILSYFQVEKNEKPKSKKSKSKEVKEKKLKEEKKEDKKKISKAKLYDKYLEATDSHYRPKSKSGRSSCNEIDIEKTKPCGGELVSDSNGCLVCVICGASEKVLISSDKPNYKEAVPDTNTYAYKRKNHLTEILSQLQAKETTDIPASVYEKINQEIKKRGIDRKTIDMFKMRRVLKKLKLRRYYEHVAHILQIINGRALSEF